MALLFTVLCGVVALTLGYFINYFATGNFVHSTQAVIDSEIKYLEAQASLPVSHNANERLYVHLDETGHLPADFPQPSRVLAEGLLVFEMPDERRYAGRIHTFEQGEKMFVGTDITSTSHDFYFMQAIGIASIIFVMVVVFVSYVISIFVVKGTNNIAGTAYDIIRTGDLSRRVDMHSRWDDLSNVGFVLNMLLDRIEDLMNGVRQVSDNIAHDLRTPLTRMRNNIEGLIKTNPDHDEYHDLLNQTDHILTTFNALLRISRIEAEKQKSQFRDVQIDNIIRDVKEFYEPLAEDKNITLTFTADKASFFGDRDLLFQAFANICDNAVKYTPKGGDIHIAIHKKPEHIEIRIENTAAPLPENILPKIFDRFYRVDESRHSAGTGLGLSLVAAVVALHGGTVKARNTHRGVEIITIL